MTKVDASTNMDDGYSDWIARKSPWNTCYASSKIHKVKPLVKVVPLELFKTKNRKLFSNLDSRSTKLFLIKNSSMMMLKPTKDNNPNNNSCNINVRGTSMYNKRKFFKRKNSNYQNKKFAYFTSYSKTLSRCSTEGKITYSGACRINWPHHKSIASSINPIQNNQLVYTGYSINRKNSCCKAKVKLIDKLDIKHNNNRSQSNLSRNKNTKKAREVRNIVNEKEPANPKRIFSDKDLAKSIITHEVELFYGKGLLKRNYHSQLYRTLPWKINY